MMDMVGDWLKQIIVVVLLATFIDLLLPNRTMQRYVKLVVSLFILMTILQPVMQLLGANANLRMLAATMDGWTLEGAAAFPPAGDAAPDGRAIPALGEILSEGEAIEQERNAHALAILEAKLASMVAEHVRTQHGVSASAKAAVELDRDGMPAIAGIRIKLGTAEGDAATSAQEAGPGAGGPMAPVEPVTIDPVRIEPVQIGGEAAGGLGREENSAQDRSGRTGVRAADRKAIAESVAKAWSIPVSKVIVE